MRLTNAQQTLLAHYFSDLSKILMGSTVIAYLVPTSVTVVSPAAFLVGATTAGACLIFAVALSPETASSL
jgi:hypothetical protein